MSAGVSEKYVTYIVRVEARNQGETGSKYSPSLVFQRTRRRYIPQENYGYENLKSYIVHSDTQVRIQALKVGNYCTPLSQFDTKQTFTLCVLN
jgi:hypothetical protein